MAAWDAEWNRLRSIGTWDESTVREAAIVKAEAKKKNEKVHIPRIFTICVEKNAELPEGHTNR